MVNSLCHIVSLVLIIVLFLAGQVFAGSCGDEALIQIDPAGQLSFFDDPAFDSLEPAIFRSLNFLEKLPPGKTFGACGKIITASDLIESLKTLQSLIIKARAGQDISPLIPENFDICRAGGIDGSGEMLVTGYFEPVLTGSMEKEFPYIYPLYGVPPDLVVPSQGMETEGMQAGRMEKGKLVPYWSRAEIEEKGILAGCELLFLTDPIENYFVHVQGSGSVRFPDGSIRRVHYAGSNGRPYRSVGKLLVEEGKMSLEDADMPHIRTYLEEHPEEQARVFHYNERFIFFRLEETRWDDGPAGSLGEPLTAGRSAALDPDCFPEGGLFYIKSVKPAVDNDGIVTGWEPMSRFILCQDAGAGIKGPGRIDIFWGSGIYATTAAGLLKHPGSLYLLIKKDLPACHQLHN